MVNEAHDVSLDGWLQPVSESLLDAAALGLTVSAWRNGPIENVHVRHIPDSEMMRMNTMMSRFFRDHLDIHPAPGRLRVRTLNTMALLVLTRLPDGRLLWEVAEDQYEDVLRHVEADLIAFDSRLLTHGREEALNRLRLIGETYASHWWLSPTWDSRVDHFVEALQNPLHPHWSAAREQAPALGKAPGRCGDPKLLAEVLKEGPDRLDAEEAAWSIRNGLGSLEMSQAA